MRSPGHAGPLGSARPPHPFDVTRWAVWQLPVRVRTFLLAVEAVAALLIASSARSTVTGDGPPAMEWGLLAILVVAFGIHVELSLHAERRRRRIAETRYCDLSTVWTFAAALTLPPVAASITVVAGFTYSYLRVARPAGTPPHRQVFSVATMILAVYAVHATEMLLGDDGQDHQSLRGAAVLALGIAVYAATNTLLVAAVIRISRPGTTLKAIFRGGDLPLEIAGLCLGAITALVIMPAGWALWPALLPPLLMLERTMLVAPLEHGATVDPKTGLLNPAAWKSATRTVLERCGPGRGAAAVLILDLDHFKSINDRYGHIAGDAVLKAVGDVIASEIRDGDLAGRFGGEEFVVCLADLRESDGACTTREVCERIRRHVERMSVTVPTAHGEALVEDLTVSVGAAVAPHAGTGTESLLARADGALYAAKGSGRNRVALHEG